VGLGDIWENFFSRKEKKDSKEDKKRKQAKDRSQFKKTDQKKADSKQDPRPKSNASQKGRVISIAPEQINVRLENGTTILCTLRGRLKQSQKKEKTLVAVGDFVYVEVTSDKEGDLTGAIESIEERRSQLGRGENLDRYKQHVIAANIDVVAIVASLYSPQFRPSIIDRYLISAEKGNLEGVIVVNKIDLLNQIDEKERALYETFCKVYSKLGYTLFEVSSKSRSGLSQLEQHLQGKAAVFSGQSGTGKSSILMALTGEKLAVADTVKKTHKGRHTTVRARLIPLESGGFFLDTPGVKSFGIWDFKKEDVLSHFFEIEELKEACHFPDCSHKHEPGCAVKEALDSGEISAIRYDSYIALLDELGTAHKRR
jgi:ribosome biogenesis GTPase / thiamine phosphate phosphatase